MRVPTSDDASCIFWEFASDYYDIGFSVQFEWMLEPPSKISLQIFDSDEDENENDDNQSEQVQVDSNSGLSWADELINSLFNFSSIISLLDLQILKKFQILSLSI